MRRLYGLDQFVEIFKMRDPLGQGIEARIHLKFRPADEVEEIAPVPIRIGQNAHVAVGSPKWLPPRADDADVTGRTKRRFERKAEQVLDISEFRSGLKHRHLDRLTAAAAFALKQCGDD